MKKLEPGADKGALVSIRDLRKASGMEKEQFDKMMLDLGRKNIISLHKHDYVAPIPKQQLDDEFVFMPTEEGRGVGSHPRGFYFVGAAIRQTHNQLKWKTLIVHGGKGSGNFGHAGRPGLQGGSSKAGMPDHVLQFRNEVLGHGGNPKTEYSVTTDKYGNVIGRVEGEDGEQSVMRLDSPRMSDSKDHLINHHNHPFDAPHSLGDMIGIAMNDGLKEQWVHSKETSYHVTIPDHVDRHDLWVAVKDAYGNAHTRALDRYLEHPEGTPRPPKEVSYTREAHEALKELANKGLIEFESVSFAEKSKGLVTHGGKGSGNFGHKGRPGQVGGSGDGGVAAMEETEGQVEFLRDSGELAAEYGVHSHTVHDMLGIPKSANVIVLQAMMSDYIRGQHVVIKATGVDSKAGKYEMTRFVGQNSAGDWIVENSDFSVENTGTGFGIEVFSKQVNYCASHGFDKIMTMAARSGEWNGYYTWARFGYDGPIRESKWSWIDENWPSLAGVRRVSDLMKTKEGRAFWKVAGHTFEGTFDLSEGSLSRRVLDAYVKAKADRGAPSNNARRRRDPGRDLGQRLVWKVLRSFS